MDYYDAIPALQLVVNGRPSNIIPLADPRSPIQYDRVYTLGNRRYYDIKLYCEDPNLLMLEFGLRKGSRSLWVRNSADSIPVCAEQRELSRFHFQKIKEGTHFRFSNDHATHIFCWKPISSFKAWFKHGCTPTPKKENCAFRSQFHSLQKTGFTTEAEPINTSMGVSLVTSLEVRSDRVDQIESRYNTHSVENFNQQCQKGADITLPLPSPIDDSTPIDNVSSVAEQEKAYPMPMSNVVVPSIQIGTLLVSLENIAANYRNNCQLLSQANEVLDASTITVNSAPSYLAESRHEAVQQKERPGEVRDIPMLECVHNSCNISAEILSYISWIDASPSFYYEHQRYLIFLTRERLHQDSTVLKKQTIREEPQRLATAHSLLPCAYLSKSSTVSIYNTSHNKPIAPAATCIFSKQLVCLLFLQVGIKEGQHREESTLWTHHVHYYLTCRILIVRTFPSYEVTNAQYICCHDPPRSVTLLPLEQWYAAVPEQPKRRSSDSSNKGFLPLLQLGVNKVENKKPSKPNMVLTLDFMSLLLQQTVCAPILDEQSHPWRNMCRFQRQGWASCSFYSCFQHDELATLRSILHKYFKHDYRCLKGLSWHEANCQTSYWQTSTGEVHIFVLKDGRYNYYHLNGD